MTGQRQGPLLALALSTLLALGCARDTAPPPEVFKRKTQQNSIGMVLTFVPGGTFLMGDPHFEDSSPVHRVTIGAFWMGQYEVTNAEFDHYRRRPRPPEAETDRQPATGISWYDAVEFCKWLSQKERRRYRLPTEAEWEYAARGGLVHKDYPWGDAPPDGRARVASLTTVEVGSYAPNGFGLYDMAGNVEEWVSDWYDPNYYGRSPERDPKGPPTSPPAGHGFKTIRGGNFSGWQPYCWLRTPYRPEWAFVYQGFRVVLEAEKSRTRKSD